MTAAILGLIAAVTAALISRSVMIGNHRQAWINGLREDLASFFTAIDLLRSKAPLFSSDITASSINEIDEARRNALLAHRKILMRLNLNESLHQKLEKSLGELLADPTSPNSADMLSDSVRLARIALKKEWEVTKHGPFNMAAGWLKRILTPTRSQDS